MTMNGAEPESHDPMRGACVDLVARDAADKQARGLANVVNEIQLLRASMDRGFESLSDRMRRKFADLPDLVDDAVRTGRHTVAPESWPPKGARDAIKATLGGGVLNLAWVILGAAVWEFVVRPLFAHH